MTDPDSLYFEDRFVHFASPNAFLTTNYIKKRATALFFKSQNLSTVLFFETLKFVKRVIFMPEKNLWTGSFFILAKTLPQVIWTCGIVTSTGSA